MCKHRGIRDAIAMSDFDIVANSLEQLMPYLNKNKVLEIVIRSENGRIKRFLKVALDELPQKQIAEKLEGALLSLKTLELNNLKQLEIIRHVAKLQQLGLVLNGLNLAATCAGFAIMYAKLNSISAEINQLVKNTSDVYTEYEFNKVLADYSDMLDSRRKQQPYPEEKMRNLVDYEYNVLALLISAFQKDITADHQKSILSIFSLLSMLTVSLRYFDEQYFFNNRAALGDQNAWHSSRDKWTSVYSKLTEQWFIERLQDYGAFETELTTAEADVYCDELLNQVVELRQEIEDNRNLILEIGDTEVLDMLHEKISRGVQDSIKAAFEKAFDGQSSPEAVEIYNAALEQVALA